MIDIDNTETTLILSHPNNHVKKNNLLSTLHIAGSIFINIYQYIFGESNLSMCLIRDASLIISVGNNAANRKSLYLLDILHQLYYYI